MALAKGVERWGVFEVVLQGPANGNPFIDVELQARFECDGQGHTVRGFYDGEGTYRIRAMPDREGEWSYETRSNVTALNGRKGAFTCTKSTTENHGPVHVSGEHFSFADGSPCFVMGTTAYAWTYRSQEVREETLRSLETYGFNKVRMLFFPKFYGDGKNIIIDYEPSSYPFEGKPGQFDFSRYDPEYFRNFEDRVHDLTVRNIQADVILFHPYDDGRWGIPQGMSHEDEMRYVEYLVARIGAYRNVWWSLANEFDLMRPSRGFRSREWDTIGTHIMDIDPYHHPRSVHNWPWAPTFPDAEWLTHVSYQHPNTYSLLMDLKKRYGKPVIDDEYQYEGNVTPDYGNASPELEMRRHWLSALAGGYATHGEVIQQSDSKRDYFWSYGGKLQGKSPKRLQFLRSIMEKCPFQDLSPDLIRSNGQELFIAHKREEFYLYFITPEHKDRRVIWVGPGYAAPSEYELTIYDAWECRQVYQGTVSSGRVAVDLPSWAVITATKAN